MTIVVPDDTLFSGIWNNIDFPTPVPITIRAPDHPENGEFGLENQHQLILYDSSNSQKHQKLNCYDDGGNLEDCGKGNDNEDECSHGDKEGYTNDSDAGHQEIQSFEATAATGDNLGQQQGQHTVLDSGNNDAGHQEIQSFEATAATGDNLGQQQGQHLLWVASGNAHDIHLALHRKYGDIVRFGPNMISVQDPAQIGTIEFLHQRSCRSYWQSRLLSLL
jgi:hypothetical protein